MTGSGAGREPDGRALDLYDIAFLAGGPARVVDTAVVGLVRSGRLRLRSPGYLATAELTRRHPVEAAVLDAVGPMGHRSVDTIRWRAIEDDRLLDVGRRLRGAGLLGRLGGLVRFVHGDRPALAPTHSGRLALRAFARLPHGEDPEAVRVALGGPECMADQRRRRDIFEPPTTALVPPRPGHRSRGVDHSDPQLAAYRTGGTAATAGVFGIGVIGGEPPGGI
jgi:hypothetical protein